MAQRTLPVQRPINITAVVHFLLVSPAVFWEDHENIIGVMAG